MHARAPALIAQCRRRACGAAPCPTLLHTAAAAALPGRVQDDVHTYNICLTGQFVVILELAAAAVWRLAVREPVWPTPLARTGRPANRVLSGQIDI